MKWRYRPAPRTAEGEAQRAAALEALKTSSITKLAPGPRPKPSERIRQNRHNQGDGRRPLKGRTR